MGHLWWLGREGDRVRLGGLSAMDGPGWPFFHGDHPQCYKLTAFPDDTYLQLNTVMEANSFVCIVTF